MRNENYNQATIIHLSPSRDNGMIEVATFDEAFGAHSNLKGKFRAKRAKKKAAKQANRQTKRMTRIKNRQERKTTRKTGRQQNRQQKAEAKVFKKATKQDARLTRKSNRQASRDTGAEDEVMPPEDQEENGAAMPPEGSVDESQEQANPPASQYSEEESGEETEESGEEAEPDSEEEGESVEETEEWNPEEESEFEGDGRSEFDFSLNDSTFDDEMNDGPRRIIISGPVMDTARKIVWNQQEVHNLKSKLGKGGNDLEIQGKLENRTNRIEQLESMLGDYSEARGGKGRSKEVRAAKKAAKSELKASRKGKGFVKGLAKKAAAPKATPVAESLSPEISEDEISIPAEETEQFVGGTGSGTTDPNQANPQNVAVTRTVELTSNASGPLAQIDLKTAAITVGAAIGVLLLLRATKVL